MKIVSSLITGILVLSSSISLACSPCAALSNVTQNLVGNNLNLTFTSNAGWNCCYTVQIEVRCQNQPFTGVPTHFSSQLCHTGGNNTNQPYPMTTIDVSGFCAGNYKWRAVETSCGIYTPTFNFTIAGPTPVLTVGTTNDTICLGESTTLTSTITGNCGPSSTTYSWTPAGSLNSGTVANPTATPAATTTYTLVATQACNTFTSSVTIVVLPAVQVAASMTSDICTSSNGSVSAIAVQGTSPFSFYWPALGANTATVSNVLTGNYTVEMTDSNGCVATDNIFVDDVPAGYAGSYTQVSCPGGNDGTAFAEMLPALGNISYSWDDPLNQTTQTAVGLSAGTYTCTITSDVGCLGTVTLVVDEIPGMIGAITAQSDVTCYTGNDGSITVNVVQGTPPYAYSWDNSTSTSNTASDLVVGNHTCTITDANGCVITVSGVLAEPPALDITFLTPSTDICPEDDITLTVTGTGGSSPYTFTWFENGSLIGTGTSIVVDPDQTNTQYCVVLSEACGSPTDQECTIINFHTPIVPASVPGSVCIPNTLNLVNTSSNPTDIATTFWEFGDNVTHTAMTVGDAPTSHDYHLPGSYDVVMTITSVYGCVYTDTLVGLATIIDKPTANFDISVNPTNIFETTVFMQDKSSYDVIQWFWSSPFSNPSTSTDVMPYFTFPIGEVDEYPITLIVESELGCRDTVTRFLKVIQQSFFAPNSFTPDGDEFNQNWKPEIGGYDVHDYEVLIFNRWGELIWENHDPEVGWDGTYKGEIVASGIYLWKAVVKDPYIDERTTFTGTVNLLK